MTRRARRALIAVMAVGAIVSAGGGADSGTLASTTATPGSAPADGLPAYDAEQHLPPDDVAALRELYDPVLQKLGVHLTRAALIDITGDQYVPSSDGRHLALYVEPTGDYSTEQYVDGFWQISALLTPDVFARWPDLESYDLCQEPLPAVDDRPEPFPVTQINITRDASAAIDWRDGDLVDLLVSARTDPDVQIVVNRDVKQNPSYMAADAAARSKAGLATTTVPATAPPDG